MRVTRILTGLALTSSAALLAGCSSGAPPRASPPASAASPTTRAPARTAAPPTTLYAPSSPQATPDRAAARLMAAWSAGDRSEAASVAAPQAVTVLFSSAYPSGYLQPRGCTAATTDPGTCTYRNTGTNEIYEVAVVRAPGGWYVSSVTPET